MIKTLVTGGTGFVGRAITRQLVEQHETVQVLSRNPLAVPPEQRVPGALYVKGDILDPQSVAAAMQDCDAIVHCVQFPGAPFENPSKGWTYNNIDGRGTEILCEAAQKQNISRLLYISGAGAGQGRQQPWFQAKDRAEKAIVATGQQWTILRPSWIYGPEDRSLNRMVDSARLPIFFPIIGDGQQKVAPVLIDDMAKV
ncbi:MAG: NAD(P)H-binding protein, partial [Deltaproteobacteria bacterium]|nr:NAD(P)H-binding protein [Deltaproteobacteria bacterium]